LLIGVGVLLFIVIDTLLIKTIDKKNTIVVVGHFKNIERFKLKNKVSVSYDLYIQENSESYKILPDWEDCFDNKGFINEIKEGQLIKISISKNSGLRSSTIPTVVSVVANNRDFLNQTCINKEINTNKIEIPLLFVGFLLIGGILIYIQKRRKTL
jgi:hypothetical protein